MDPTLTQPHRLGHSVRAPRGTRLHSMAASSCPNMGWPLRIAPGTMSEAVLTKNHRRGNFKDRNLFCHFLESDPGVAFPVVPCLFPGVQVWALLGPPSASICTWSHPVCIRLSLKAPSHKLTVILDWGPAHSSAASLPLILLNLSHLNEASSVVLGG